MASFTVTRRDRWSLVAPGGEPFPWIGVAHADDTNLRHPHNLAIWHERYGGSGLGTSGLPVDLGHSEGLPGEDLAGAGVPYTLALRVAEIESWNGHPAYREPRSPALVDGPAWTGHPTGAGWDGPLDEIARAYCATAAAAIRRHDPDHLLLGDRFGTRAGAPDEVLDAAAEHVDVLSVQAFPGPDPDALEAALERVEGWHRRTGLPVLVADTGNWCPTRMSPHRTGSARDQAERGEGCARTAAALAARDWCLGWNWCGYVENPQRGWGLKDPWDEPYEELVGRASAANRAVAAGWAARRA